MENKMITLEQLVKLCKKYGSEEVENMKGEQIRMPTPIRCAQKILEAICAQESEEENERSKGE